VGFDDVTEVIGGPAAVDAAGLKIVEKIPHWWKTGGSVDEALGFFDRRERATPLKGTIEASMQWKLPREKRSRSRLRVF
jgi:hypothetical protein